MNTRFTSNRAFLYGDAVSVYFFIRKNKPIMLEECYFHLMASMRKMKMAIPLSFTLEYISSLIEKKIKIQSFSDATLHFLVFRNENSEKMLFKNPIDFVISTARRENPICLSEKKIKVDLIKEININNNLLNGIFVHSPENIYAEIYAQENDLDDIIFLNPEKRVARGISGNYLFLQGETIKIPKQKEGAYISPLMENLFTYIYKNKLANIEQIEMNPFETQKAEEILLVSDAKGIFSVKEIRNKTFSNQKFTEIIENWKKNF